MFVVSEKYSVTLKSQKKDGQVGTALCTLGIMWVRVIVKTPGANAILYTKIRSKGIEILFCRTNQI